MSLKLYFYIIITPWVDDSRAGPVGEFIGEGQLAAGSGSFIFSETTLRAPDKLDLHCYLSFPICRLIEVNIA